MNTPYGQELILDLHGCNAETFTRRSIAGMLRLLCRVIDMKREDLHFWDETGVPVAQRQTNPKTKGTSAVQFILTSSVVIHTLDELGAVYVNIFSCKDFDAKAAAEVVAKWFAATEWTSRVLERR